MDMNQYLDIFIEESKEHLQSMNELLLNLENASEDINLLNEIFRIAHTLKGMSGTMGYVKMANLTHEMENVLQLVRNSEIKINNDIINILFECFDTLDDFINELINSGTEGDINPDALVAKLASIVSGDVAATVDEVAVALEVPMEQDVNFDMTIDDITNGIAYKAGEEGFASYKVRVELNEKCMLKAARAFIVFNMLEKFGEIVKSYPTAEEIEDEKFENSFELLFITKLTADRIQSEILTVSEIDVVYVDEYMPHDSKIIKEVKKNFAENDEEKSLTPKKVSPVKKKSKGKTTKTVRVDIHRLDNLMNLVSELIIIKTRLEDIESTKEDNSTMFEAVEYLERITTSLHDAVMKVRMVPIERVFNRFPRMVRDLSKDLGKEINLFMSGEETEVDRTVIDEIGDPLIHLLRNSIDHGIEDPAIRKELGKDQAGNVYLRAYPDGNNVVIEIEDDGSGIDVEKVKQKALDKNIVTLDEVENMKSQEAINLLFKPGFSTAEKVSDISGRGVGLDVVKTKIESLDGLVEVHSEKDKGSKFIIRLPLTLAIIQALMVTIGSEKYALPLNSIKEIATIKTDSIRKVQDQEVILFRDNTLPLLRMQDILQTGKEETQKDELIIVVVKKGDKTAGLIVDDLIGQQEVVIKSLGKYLSGIKVIAGATILGNGQIALIIDPNSLF